MKRSRGDNTPVCYWCRIPIEPGHPYRGTAPELLLPAGSGVVVCSPMCPERPAERIVYTAASIAGRGAYEHGVG